MHNNSFSQHNNQQSPQAHRTPNEACPSWDGFNHTCMRVKDGLFLPIVQHVAAYCQSSQHPLCPHYQLRVTAQEVGASSYIFPGDRRCANRVFAHLLFRFSETTNNGLTVETQQDKTWTIDVSEAGVCFASTRVLRSNTAIHFSLEIDGTAQKIEGVGQVIWSAPHANTQLFHTGIAFTEQRASLLFPQHHKPNQHQIAQKY